MCLCPMDVKCRNTEYEVHFLRGAERCRSEKYGESHYLCAAYKDKDIFNKYLDLHYEIKKNHVHNL